MLGDRKLVVIIDSLEPLITFLLPQLHPQLLSNMPHYRASWPDIADIHENIWQVEGHGQALGHRDKTVVYGESSATRHLTRRTCEGPRRWAVMEFAHFLEGRYPMLDQVHLHWAVVVNTVEGPGKRR